jgi:type 1 glutamine amidotransferase
MNRRSILLCALLAMAALPGFASSKHAPFSVLAFYSANVEHDHVEFAEQSLRFFSEMAKRDHLQFSSTTNWEDLNSTRLAHVDVVLWLNDCPHTDQQRAAFEQYMERGGGWLGFHAAAYNDSDTHWPWFVKFLGGSVFYGNNWPPLPATIRVDDIASPVTRRLPSHFESPANEWYSWLPSPRANKDVKVLLTLDTSNYPLGFKDTLTSGDIPVMWTNTRYRMIYMNMGHGDKIFTDAHQNELFEDALRWLGGRR